MNCPLACVKILGFFGKKQLGKTCGHSGMKGRVLGKTRLSWQVDACPKGWLAIKIEASSIPILFHGNVSFCRVKEAIVMDYSSILSRYIGREVCVSTFGQIKLRGEVAAIYDDCVRLINATSIGETDDTSWLDANSQKADGHFGQNNNEALVHFHHIVSISCADDELLDLPVTDQADSEWFQFPSVPEAVVEPEESFEVWEAYLGLDRLVLEVGCDLISLVDPEKSDVMDRVGAVRCQLADSLGVALPKLRVRDSLRLGDSEYRFMIDENEVARATFGPGKYLALDMGSTVGIIDGVPGKDPTFGGPGLWISPDQVDASEEAGYLAIEPTMLLVTHFQEIMKKHAHELLSLQDVKYSLDRLRVNFSAGIEELRTTPLNLSIIHGVLCRLLEEGESIKNMPRILESLTRHANKTTEVELLLATVRVRLGRQLCQKHIDEQGRVHAIGLERNIEERLLSLTEYGQGRLARSWVERLVDTLSEMFQQIEDQHQQVALIVPVELRSKVWQLIAAQLPKLSVLSYAEIPRDIEIYWETKITAEEIGLPESVPNKVLASKEAALASTSKLVEKIRDEIPRQPR
ncbi:MAG: hypothetical protein COA78_25975 [Blastopirellula sp.]|nr:MAG: hypothetical protein COA78_25975 [Blastopirellula sp.]